MPELDLSATSVDLTRAVCDIPSVSGEEAPLADAIQRAIGDLPHLEVFRDGDTIVARTDLGRAQRVVIAGDFAILGEPSNGQVEGGCNGNLRAIVRAHGVRSHSARAWVGENAIHKAAPILARLAEYRPREVPVEGLVYREGLNAVRISGG